MEREKLAAGMRQRISHAVDRLPGLRKRYILLIVLVAIGMIFFRKYFIGLVLVAATVTFAILVKRAELNKLGLEISTFSTVLAGYHFGPETGAIMGLVLITAQMLTGRPGVYILWVVPTYVAAGYTAGTFAAMDISMLGTLIAAGMQTVFLVSTALLSRRRLAEYFQYASFNFTFNLVLFHGLAPLAVKLMAAGPVY